MLSAVGRGLRAVLILFVITLAMLIAAEFIAQSWEGHRAPPDVGAERAGADTYAGADWPAAYFEEFARANRTAWHPYVYWRRQPFAGRYINIDARGVRRTWKAPEAGAGARKVFVLGGSLAWGTGARDDHTIASEIARGLARAGLPDVEVTNFAEGGYVSMQEVILLADEIRRGNRPDAVVFLDGVNDLFAAYQSGVPGIPQNEANRVREFNIDVDDRIYREALAVRLRDLALFRLFAPRAAEEAVPWSPTLEAQANGALQVYLSTVELARRLAASYGFAALFYWQPIAYTKARPTAYEQEAAHQPDAEFFRHAYAMAGTALPGGPVRDLSGVFGDDPQPVYIDFCHIGEKGNEIIAGVIVADLLSLWRRDSRS